MARIRKTPQTWIDAGLTALKKAGPDGLRAETLARSLNTTKGSFYWHFKDVPAFQDAVLAAWLAAAKTRFDKVLAPLDGDLAKLRALADYRPNPLDRAVRAWAIHATSARKTQGLFDSHCTEEIGALLSSQGATHPDFPHLVHSALIAGPPRGTHAETLIDLLLVLK